MVNENKNESSYLLPIIIAIFITLVICAIGGYYYYKTEIIPKNTKIEKQKDEFDTLKENSVSKYKYEILKSEKNELQDNLDELDGSLDAKNFIIKAILKVAKTVIYESGNHKEGYRNFSKKEDLDQLITILDPKVRKLKNGQFPIIVKIHSDNTQWGPEDKNIELSMKRGLKFIPFLNTLNIEEENNICFQYSKLNEKRSIEIIEITK